MARFRPPISVDASDEPPKSISASPSLAPPSIPLATECRLLDGPLSVSSNGFGSSCDSVIEGVKPRELSELKRDGVRPVPKDQGLGEPEPRYLDGVSRLNPKDGMSPATSTTSLVSQAGDNNVLAVDRRAPTPLPVRPKPQIAVRTAQSSACRCIRRLFTLRRP